MYTFITNLYPEECARKLDIFLQENRGPAFCGNIRGSVNFQSNSFELYKDREPNFDFFHSRNDINLIFYGKFIKTEHGTLIQGNFNISSSTKVLLIILAVLFFPFIPIIAIIVYLSLNDSYSQARKDFILKTIKDELVVNNQ